MFQFTKFDIEDFIDSSVFTMFIVSLNNRYMVYNGSRRRLTISDPIQAAFKSPLDLLTNDNLALWTRTSRYRVRGEDALFAPHMVTYKQASDDTRDRYDIHQMMRRLLTPRSLSDMPRLMRGTIANRIDFAVDSFARKHDPVAYGVHTPNPHAVFKDNHFYSEDAFSHARRSFQRFGHLVARAKAGDESVTNDQISTAFYDLSSRYSDATSHIENAFEAVSDMDLGIVHCDCGHYESEYNTHDVRNDTWCESCFDDDAVYCEDNGEYWPRDDAYYSESRDAYYTYDRDAENDDDDDDDEDDRNQPIMSYSTNVLHVLDCPSGITSSHFGEFTMGIELEMTSGDHDSNEAAELVRSRLGSTYCIIKSDGSLPYNGFEVVTSPQGLAKHIEVFKAWEIDPAYRAWNTGKCGMHIHIDSRAFTQLTVGKFLMFINSNGNVDFIRKIAGRHPSVDDQARSYCAAEHQSILTNPKKAVKGKSGERYRMVNMMNLGSREAKRLGLNMDNSYNGKYNTVELRIFRASLKKERLLAQIEFTHASVMFCRVASWRDLNGTSFVKWLKTVAGQYPALVKWYGVRNVHTSTPTVIAPAQDTCTDAVPPAPWTPENTEERHHQIYPIHIPYDNEAETIRAWVSLNGLHFRFATYAGSEYAFFPYGGDLDRISNDDVVYMRVGELWVLMNELFATTLSECAYEVSLDQPV
jgi:hypothetical protein